MRTILLFFLLSVIPLFLQSQPANTVYITNNEMLTGLVNLSIDHNVERFTNNQCNSTTWVRTQQDEIRSYYSSKICKGNLVYENFSKGRFILSTVDVTFDSLTEAEVNQVIQSYVKVFTAFFGNPEFEKTSANKGQVLSSSWEYKTETTTISLLKISTPRQGEIAFSILSKIHMILPQ